jgi:hypothetical protein
MSQTKPERSDKDLVGQYAAIKCNDKGGKENETEDVDTGVGVALGIAAGTEVLS